jgi:hypothetical protein
MRSSSHLRNLAAVATAFLLPGAVLAAPAPLEVRYGPDDRLLAYPVAGGGVPAGNATVVLHNISIFNLAPASVRVTRLRIEAASNGAVTNSNVVQSDALESAAGLWSRRQSSGRLATHEPLFQVAKLIAGRRLSSSALLASGTGFVVARTPMLVKADAAEIVVTAEGVNRDGRAVAGELRIPIVQHRSANSYRFPLCGRWLIAAGPNLNGHHRWGASQEFAIDLGRVGADTTTHSGDGSRADMFYAFGAPVVAVADGEVVQAESGHRDAEQLRSAGETQEQFEKRLESQQEELIASGFRNIIGNHVVLRHSNGEYSVYAHLKAGSVRVRNGDRVLQGAVLAELGNSGNSTEPHLHFSIQDGPDPLASRSIPFRFDGLRFWDEADGGTGVLNSGQIVEAEGCDAASAAR